MATTFLEPGGDADFLVGTTNGFWAVLNGGGGTIATDFVHGSHVKSIRFTGAIDNETKAGVLADAGSRISMYVYIAAYPSAASNLFELRQSASSPIMGVGITSTGVLRFLKAGGTQIGVDGTTLSTGVWYRLSLSYTITSTSINSFRLYKDGILDISGTNLTLPRVLSSKLTVGNVYGTTVLDFRTSDHYTDNITDLTDPGNIWVTAKRPNANGTANNFSTQIGAGGSGYGTGHSPQINERPLDTANGWSMIGAGSTVTEEYNIEGKSVGDINIASATIIDWIGWISTKALAGTPTIQIVLDGVNNAQAINTTITLYTKVKGSATYPTGTGADIGMVTDTSLTTESLYECGVLVAFIPSSAVNYNLTLLGAGT